MYKCVRSQVQGLRPTGTKGEPKGLCVFTREEQIQISLKNSFTFKELKTLETEII